MEILPLEKQHVVRPIKELWIDQRASSRKGIVEESAEAAMW